MGTKLHQRGLRVVQVQNPRIDPRQFDLVIVNHHDELNGPNVLVTRTALHGVTQAKLRAAKAAWSPKFLHMRRPLVAALVGGANGRLRFGEGEAAELAFKLALMMRSSRSASWSPHPAAPGKSRSPSCAAALEPLGGYVWDLQGENPYLGFLAIADAIVVTMDSISMISEACATRAPVFVQPLPGKSRRIGLFIQMLEREKRIRMFETKYGDVGRGADR